MKQTLKPPTPMQLISYLKTKIKIFSNEEAYIVLGDETVLPFFKDKANNVSIVDFIFPDKKVAVLKYDAIRANRLIFLDIGNFTVRIKNIFSEEQIKIVFPEIYSFIASKIDSIKENSSVSEKIRNLQKNYEDALKARNQEISELKKKLSLQEAELNMFDERHQQLRQELFEKYQKELKEKSPDEKDEKIKILEKIIKQLATENTKLRIALQKRNEDKNEIRNLTNTHSQRSFNKVDKLRK